MIFSLRSAQTLATAAGSAACLTASQHLLLRDADIPVEYRYVLGVAAILGPFATWAEATGNREALIALTVIAAAAGVAPFVGHQWHRSIQRARIAALKGAQRG